MEINVFTPGGLGSAQSATGVDFAGLVIEDLERKVRLKHERNDCVSNVELATM
jgi:glutathione synthase